MTKPQMDGNANPASVHLVLQGKGGVGKSFVSAILAQYFRTKSAPVHCLDTDPVNATFAQYRLLEAEHLKVLRRGTINEKQFDLFVERVCQGDGVFIVDTGATTFVPLWNYILENEILDFFSSHGRRVFVHSVVTGGQAMTDTLSAVWSAWRTLFSPVEALSRALGARQSGDSPANEQAIENEYDRQNMQYRKEAFLAAQRNRQGDDYLHSTRQAPLSRYEIKAGWEIPAVLEQSLNSDLPGDLKALVTSNVYDTAMGLYLLIPQGSRLIGKYDSRVSYGQEGVQVVWNRIIYPDASSIDLDGMMGLDSRGNAGLRDHVDHHCRRLVGFSILTSLFTAAFEVSQRTTQSALAYPTPAQTAGAAVGQELSQTDAQITRRNLNVQPTIKVPAGYRFTVRVNRDILFEAPYQSLDANPLPTSRRGRAGG